MENPTNKQLPRDVFLYLLAVVTLGMVSVNFGTLLFQFVNIYVPDLVLDRYVGPHAYDGAIHWAVATLVIVFPVFVWVMRFLKKDVTANPEKSDLKIRRWLLYLTLFVAAVTIIGDLVALVYNFLQGELTAQFVLKILIILFIAGTVFYYYLNELREKTQRNLKTLSWAVVSLVVVSVVAGMFIAGLPQSQRERRIDEQRIYDLQNIQSQIIVFWQSKGRLPNNLDELRDTISGFSAPTDPETQQPYEYTVKGKLQFELCATFKTEASQSEDSMMMPKAVPARPYPQDNWAHGVGRVCFDRTIDPQIYEVPGKPIPLR